jgi:hypothetical protein
LHFGDGFCGRVGVYPDPNGAGARVFNEKRFGTNGSEQWLEMGR